MEEVKNQYLGNERLLKLMFKFSVPCVLSLLVSALYNIVDQIFIGNSELGTLGNAATGVVFPIFIVSQAFAWCLGDGCAADLNIRQGRNEADLAHKTIGSGITVTLIASLVLIAVFFPVKKPMLTLFGASENSMPYAEIYFDIVLSFFPAYMLMNMTNSVIRADGSPAWAMVSMLAGAAINIVLDGIFIFVCKWGMAGAAWATVIGQVVSFAIGAYYLAFKSKTFKLRLKSFIPNFKSLANALKLGMSSFITQMTIVVIAVVCNVMLARYGAQSEYGADIPIALIAVESKVFTVVINIVVGIVLGCQPVIGYNIGAKKFDRVKKLYLYILACTVIISAVFTVLFEAAPRAVASIFGEPKDVDPAAYWDFATKLFRIFLMFVTFTCIIKMSSIFFQAAGKPVFAVIASLVRDIVCFVPLVCTLPLGMGIDGILWAAPISDAIAIIVTAVITVIYWRGVYKTAKSEPADKETHAEIIQPSKPGVIITIGREHGSSGKQIGKVVAEKLGIPFYYKEMTALAAQESGLDKEFISEINANSPNVLHDLYLSTNVVQQVIAAQDKIIRKIADNGSCVIVGRAADYVLRNYENVVKIFIHAPEDYKVKRIMEIYGDSEEDAKNSVKRSDKARGAYYKNITGNKWGDAANYNLCVDSSVGVEKSAEVILNYLKDKA